MKIVSTFHQPSTVISSLKCRLTSTDTEHLVVAKPDGIDVYAIQPQGLEHQCRWNVWGNILSLKSVPTADASSRANLLVLLDHPDPELIFLTYTPAGTLLETKRLELFERNQRPAEFFNDVIVHPDGKLAIVKCYTGKLKGIILKAGNYHSDFDASITEYTVLSIAFLPSPEECSIAILHLDHNQKVQLHARTVRKGDILRDTSAVLHPTPISSKILPEPEDYTPKLISVPCPRDAVDLEPDDETPSFIGGVLVVGGSRILLFEISSAHGQAKQRNKRRKLERAKESGSQVEMDRVSAKNAERDARKRKPKAFVEWPWSTVASWCAIEGEPLRYIIGDCFGRLAMLSLHDVPNSGLILIPLGETSAPTTLTYLTNQVLYVGSHSGDSQLVKLSATPLSDSTESTLPLPFDIDHVFNPSRLAPSAPKGKGREEDELPLRNSVVDTKGKYLRVVETFKNIAPIQDAILVDTDNSGHLQIVTCSGGQNTGSIHVMRKGADFRTLATIGGMPHTVGAFPLRRMYNNLSDSHILVSTVHATYPFEIRGNDVLEAVEPMGVGFAPGRTLAARNVQRVVVHEAIKRGSTTIMPERIEYTDSALVVQVTADGAYLLEFDMMTFTQVHTYNVTARGQSPELQVVAACISPAQTVLALNNGKLICLEVGSDNTFRVKRESDKILHHQVSALSCTPLNPRDSISEFIAVAYWQTNTIGILRQVGGGGFETVWESTASPGRPVVRCLVMHDFGNEGEPHPYLLAGFGDGSFASFPWNANEYTLGEPKITSLGSLPVSFSACTVDNRKVLFAAGSRAVVLSWERDRILTSPVMLKDVMVATQIQNENYESALILANESALFIGRIQEIENMHIRSVPLGYDAPKQIVYQPLLKVFGVVCTRQVPTRIGSREAPPQSVFKLLDDTSFSCLSQFDCDLDEEFTAVAPLTLEQHGDATEFFCLGTFFYDPEQSVPNKGRIIALTAYPIDAGAQSSARSLSLAASAEVKGCVYALTPVNGLLAVGVNSAVMLFRLEMDPTTKACKLHNVSTLDLWYFATSISAYGNKLVLGDRITSISLLEVTKDLKLKALGRDLSPMMPVSVQALDESHIIAASDTLNLMSFTPSENEVTKKLDRDGFYQQGDLVNKFVQGSIAAPDPGSPLVPIQMFFASSGRIGIIIDIADQQLALDLTDLQRNLAGVMQHVKAVTRFRTPQSSARKRVVETAYGFLDGDFLERLLNVEPAHVAKIISGCNEAEQLKRPLHEFQQLLKTLQALH